MRRKLLPVLLLSTSFLAHASPRSFAMIYDAEITGEGNIETESWLEMGHPANPDHVPEGQHNVIWWAGGRVGWIEKLELAGFVTFEQKDRIAVPTDANGVPKTQEESLFNLMMILLEAKWSPFEPGALPVDPYVQLQYLFWPDSLSSRPGHPHQLHLTLGASRRWSRWSGAAQLAYWDSTVLDLGDGPKRWMWIDLGAGAAYSVLEGDGGRFPALSVGLEWWGILSLGRIGPGGAGLVEYSEHVHSHQVHHGGMFVGPSVSFTRGRLWGVLHVALPLLVPTVRQPESLSMIRLILGIAL